MKKQRYFVCNRQTARSQSHPEADYEIQVLDAQGRGKHVGYLRYGDTEIEIGGQPIPKAVIDAAHRQPEGKGDYVNEGGQSISPF